MAFPCSLKASSRLATSRAAAGIDVRAEIECEIPGKSIRHQFAGGH
jgi:hypothetical protein